MVFETAFAVVVAGLRFLSSVSSKVFNGYMSIGIDVLLSPDGQTIARASWDGTILVCDIHTINQQKRLRK